MGWIIAIIVFGIILYFGDKENKRNLEEKKIQQEQAKARSMQIRETAERARQLIQEEEEKKRKAEAFKQAWENTNKAAEKIDLEIPIVLDGVRVYFKRLIREVEYEIVDREIGKQVCRDLLERYKRELAFLKAMDRDAREEEWAFRYNVLMARIQQLEELLESLII